MTLRFYLLIMSLTTAVAWFGWIMIVMNQPPQEGVAPPLILFYASLFIALVGTFSIVGFLIRFHTQEKELPFRQVALAFRQAVSYAAIVVILLILQGARMLTAINTIFLLLAFILLELFFVTQRKEAHNE